MRHVNPLVVGSSPTGPIFMKHITRDRYLTKEEADKYDKIREQIEMEYKKREGLR